MHVSVASLCSVRMARSLSLSTSTCIASFTSCVAARDTCWRPAREGGRDTFWFTGTEAAADQAQHTLQAGGTAQPCLGSGTLSCGKARGRRASPRSSLRVAACRTAHSPDGTSGSSASAHARTRSQCFQTRFSSPKGSIAARCTVCCIGSARLQTKPSDLHQGQRSCACHVSVYALCREYHEQQGHRKRATGHAERLCIRGQEAWGNRRGARGLQAYKAPVLA